jgi:hypothetical protein
MAASQGTGPAHIQSQISIDNDPKFFAYVHGITTSGYGTLVLASRMGNNQRDQAVHFPVESANEFLQDLLFKKDEEMRLLRDKDGNKIPLSHKEATLLLAPFMQHLTLVGALLQPEDVERRTKTSDGGVKPSMNVGMVVDGSIPYSFPSDRVQDGMRKSIGGLDACVIAPVDELWARSTRDAYGMKPGTQPLAIQSKSKAVRGGALEQMKAFDIMNVANNSVPVCAVFFLGYTVKPKDGALARQAKTASEDKTVRDNAHVALMETLATASSVTNPNTDAVVDENKCCMKICAGDAAQIYKSLSAYLGYNCISGELNAIGTDHATLKPLHSGVMAAQDDDELRFRQFAVVPLGTILSNKTKDVPSSHVEVKLQISASATVYKSSAPVHDSKSFVDATIASRINDFVITKRVAHAFMLCVPELSPQVISKFQNISTNLPNAVTPYLARAWIRARVKLPPITPPDGDLTNFPATPYTTNEDFERLVVYLLTEFVHCFSDVV